jgi:hypothetical protein
LVTFFVVPAVLCFADVTDDFVDGADDAADPFTDRFVGGGLLVDNVDLVVFR